jgi:protein SCO1/2
VAKRLALLLAALVLCACSGRSSDAPKAPDFRLTSDRGTSWSLSEQRGREVAIYFGYTRCTDTCPDTLAKLAKAMQAAKAGNGEVAFITIDPAHDTPAVLRKYVAKFSGAPIIGLTGTPPEIAAVENMYHIYADAKDDTHSTFSFLVNPQGDQTNILDDDAKPSHIADLIRSDIE